MRRPGAPLHALEGKGREETKGKGTGGNRGAGNPRQRRSRRWLRLRPAELRRDRDAVLGHGKMVIWPKIGRAGRGEYIYGGGSARGATNQLIRGDLDRDSEELVPVQEFVSRMKTAQWDPASVQARRKKNRRRGLRGVGCLLRKNGPKAC